MKKPKQIIAMGGGGFSMEPDNPLLDDYVLAQSPVKNPRICFLPTASRDHMDLIQPFFDFFMTRDCRPTNLSLTHPATYDIEDFILSSDIIYVGGGHTGIMLKIWRTLGVDKVLKKALDLGIVLAGVSAGASCWFDMGFTDSNPDRLSGEPCLGFVPGSHCSHYENPGRRPEFHDAVTRGEIPEGFGTENFAALHIVGGELTRVVSSRPGAAANLVKKGPGGISEQRIEGTFIEELLD